MYDTIFMALGGIRKTATGWSAKCPAHADHGPSLSIRISEDGRLLLHCFAGCRLEEILAALGVTVADLFPSPRRDARPRAAAPGREAVAAISTVLHQRQKYRDAESAYETAELLYLANKQIDAARRLATSLGDTEAAWGLLEEIAAAERLVWQIESGQ